MIAGAGDVLQRFWFAMAGHLWQTTIVLALLGLLGLALRRAPARFVCLAAWLGVAKLLLPLHLFGQLSGGLFARLAGGDVSTVVTVVPGDAVGVWLYPALFRAAADGSFRAPWLWVGMSALWLTGTVVLGWRFVAARRRGVAPREISADELPEKVRDRLLRALRVAAVPSRAVRLVAGPVVPSVSGLLRPRITVSAELVARLDAEDLATILVHEEEHRRRRDPLWSAVLAGITVPFFFFPPVWWLRRRIHDATEMACDEAVLAAGHPARRYSRALARTLDLALVSGGAVTAIHGRRPSTLRRRFAHLGSIQDVPAPAGTRRLRTMPRHRWILATAGMIVLVGSIVPFSPTAAPLAEVGDVTNPQLIADSKVEPVYPEDAREAKVEGHVVLQAIIDEQGNVGKVEVLRNNRPDYPSFAESATDAVRQWRYEPATQEGKPVAVYFTIFIEFRLDGEDEKEADRPDPADAI